MFSNALRSLLVSGLDGYGRIARMLFTQLSATQLSGGSFEFSVQYLFATQ